MLGYIGMRFCCLLLWWTDYDGEEGKDSYTGKVKVTQLPERLQTKTLARPVIPVVTR